jgi:predicted PurR-regulated permease PerM
VALFFAVVLNPAVDFLTNRGRIRRGWSTAIVMLVGFAALGGMLYAFIAPLVDQVEEFADDLPGYVEDARNGEGTIGELVERYELEEWVDENQDRIRDFAGNLGTPALDVVQRVFAGVAAAITILVLTILLLLQGPKLTAAVVDLLPDRHQQRAARVARDCARAVAGYVGGNVLISLIAGLSTWLVLTILDVPYAGVLGLWVGFCDLVPLIGATIGAVPTVGFAFLHSIGAGIAAAIFFIAYQQFENHVLQVTVMSRTVNVNPLTVLVSVLVAVELFGLLGALLAIPGAGVIQVVVRDVYDERRGRLKPEPTVGVDEIPADSSHAE